jgi:methyl-accepting chemotaxis protein
VTRTTAPGWYLFVSSDLPRASAARIIVLAGITAAALALLVAALLLLGIARARGIDRLVRGLEHERDAAAAIVRDVGAAALRLRSAAGTLRERAALLAAEAADGKAAGAEAASLLSKGEERSAELRSGIAARMSLLDDLGLSAKEAAGKSREARSAAETAGLSAADAQEELNRVITMGSAVSLSVENAVKGVDAVVEAAERIRLLALNAALDASRSGGQGARVAEDMWKLAEEQAGHALALAAALAEARSSMRIVGRASQEAGKAVHQATEQSAAFAHGLDQAWRGVDAMLSRLEAANSSAAGLREEMGISDRSRSAVDGVARIMARIESLCAEIASLASAVAAESTQAAQKTSLS